jgi:hypothetical protein
MLASTTARVPLSKERNKKNNEGTDVPAEPQLTGEEKEWLFRAATGHPSALIPPTVVMVALVAAGLGYLADEHLMSAPKPHRRR